MKQALPSLRYANPDVRIWLEDVPKVTQKEEAEMPDDAPRPWKQEPGLTVTFRAPLSAPLLGLCVSG